MDIREYVKSRNFVFARKPSIDAQIVFQKPHQTWIEMREVWKMEHCPDTPMHTAYALDGSFIGEPKEARMLEKYGIVAERRDPKLNVASIGFAPQSGK